MVSGFFRLNTQKFISGMGRKRLGLSKKYNNRPRRKTESLIKQVRKLIREPKRNVERAENAIIDISPAHAMLEMMDEIASPPDMYYPNVEYNQKNDDTPLPVGNLQTFFQDLSKQAQNEWQNWVGSLSEPIDKLLFTEEEQLLMRRYRRVVSVEDKRWLIEQEERARRAISESKGFLNCKTCDLQAYNHTFKNPTGADRVRYSPSHKERAELAHRTEFETNVARKNSINNQDYLFPNCGPNDDPDYLTSGDINRSFNCLKPTSRVYDAVYKVFRADGKFDILYPNRKKGKDYTAEKDIAYLYSTKKIPLLYADGVPKIETLGPTKFELDLRVTKGTEPNPRDYKKIDPFSPAGLKITEMIDGQPHLWTEYSWDYKAENKPTTKKVAWALTIPHTSSGVITIWFYMDDRFVSKQDKKISESNFRTPIRYTERRKVRPYITYIEQKCAYWPNRPLQAKLIAQIVYHIKFKKFAENMGKKLSDPYMIVDDCKIKKPVEAVYILVKSTTDIFDVVTDVYVRKDALSKKDRDRFILCEADWMKKYASNKS